MSLYSNFCLSFQGEKLVQFNCLSLRWFFFSYLLIDLSLLQWSTKSVRTKNFHFLFFVQRHSPHYPFQEVSWSFRYRPKLISHKTTSKLYREDRNKGSAMGRQWIRTVQPDVLFPVSSIAKLITALQDWTIGWCIMVRWGLKKMLHTVRFWVYRERRLSFCTKRSETV